MRKDPTEFRERFKRWKEGLPAYKDGKPVEDEEFESFRQTLPDNQKPIGAYRTKRYWELNGKPKTFGEAIGQGMYSLGDSGQYGQYGIEIPAWHANSVAFDESTGNYEFIKPNTHDTRWMEDVYGYWSPDNQDFRENYKLEKGIIYDKYVPKKNVWKLPTFDGGKDGETTGGLLNQYDNFVNNHPTIATVASYLPFVGTAMDLLEAYKNPTAENIGYAALSGGTDIFGGRLLMKLAGKGIKSMKAQKKLAESLKKEYSSWSYYQNMPKNEARRQIKSIVKQKVGYQADDIATSMSPYVGAAAVYTPDFIANINQHR